MDGTSYIALGGCADGRHRVPNVNVNANSDGDFNFNLGNFENAWNDNNAFFCFCDLRDFSSYRCGGVFSPKLFLHPPNMRPTSSKSKMSAP